MARASLNSLSNKDWSMFILRLAIGAIFLFHGTQKWVFWSGVPEGVPPFLGYIMLFLSIAEPLAGVALIAGYQTILAVLGLTAVMVGALVMKIVLYAQPFEAWEMDLLLLAACVAVLIEGGGSIALEAKTTTVRATAPAKSPASTKKKRK
jgi:uncharacterized membrane protein YphA (DoxX/SURF4 family)